MSATTHPQNRYVLATGEGAAARLRVVHQVHGADTRRLLIRAGLSRGMHAVDMGCGVGVITRWMARRVGPSGSATGVDISSEQIAAAQAATPAGRVQFFTAPAEDTGLPGDTYDFVYCRFLLMHSASPEGCLREMKRIARPGGLIVCEEGDFTAPFCDPPSEAFDRSFALYRALGAHRGLDFCIGRRLYRLFLQLELADLHVSLVQPAYAEGPGKDLPRWTLEEFADGAIAAGLTTRAEVAALLAEMARLTQDPGVLFGMARMTQVWARKV
ncbi:MAG: class I SAM-dependent methyltransferase [Chthonomonadales bacterium]